MSGDPGTGGWTPALRAWVAAWALLGALLAGLVAHQALGAIPHVQDEVVYTWQAERLAEGRLRVPAPEPRAAHAYHFFLDRDGLRAGIFPNGWPAVLALGVLVGAPAYVNAVLHGLAVLLAAAVARSAGGRAGALLAAPLVAVAPQAVLQGASRMSHALVAVLALVVVRWAVAPDARPAGWRRGLLVGAALGGIVLTRPFDALVIALVLLPFVYRSLPGRREAVALGATLLAALALTAAQNRLLTGDATRFAQDAYFDEMPAPVDFESWRYGPGCNDLGFGPDRGCFTTRGTFGHTPKKAVEHTEHNLRLAGSLWMGTPWALLLLPAGLFLGSSRRLAAVAIALLAGLVVAYAFYWFHGSCLGARFYHPALAPVVCACAVAARGLLARLGWSSALGLVLLLPMAWKIPQTLPELAEYWAVDDRFHVLQREWDRGPALVLVGYRDETRLSVSPETAALGVRAAPVLWRGSWFGATDGPLRFAEYHPELVDATRAAYPGLPVHLYVMSGDRRFDELRPLAESDRAERQLADLPLPRNPPLFPPPPPPPRPPRRPRPPAGASD